MLDAHPQIEIRIYNPTGVVGRAVLPKVFAFAADFVRMNRRMHNKALIIDGAVAVIGGRNIADQYYDMNREYNFRDRDVVAVGPVVGEIEGGFDRYWNSIWAVPVAAYVRVDFSEAERTAYYDRLHAYAGDPKNFPDRFNEELLETHARLHDLERLLLWGDARVIYDHPGKNDDPARMNAFGEMGRELTAAASRAEREILAETPYLVMMPGTFTVLRGLQERGVRVRVLTNSLASTDEPYAFSRYAMQRDELLRLGVELHESMPHPQYLGKIVTRLPRMQRPTRLALHAKTMVIDRRIVFIGSFNMDPRSTHLNTEMGILIDSGELAAEIAAMIERGMDPGNCWTLTRAANGGTIAWSSVIDGQAHTFDQEPEASAAAMLEIFLFSLLPFDSLI
jgi:putative cardiolipin synthase